MATNKKTLSEDKTYPQFAFRVSKEDKVALRALLEDVHRKVNKTKKKEPIITKNEILLWALMDNLGKLRSGKERFPED